MAVGSIACRYSALIGFHDRLVRISRMHAAHRHAFERWRDIARGQRALGGNR